MFIKHFQKRRYLDFNVQTKINGKRYWNHLQYRSVNLQCTSCNLFIMKIQMEENLQNINGNTKRESPKILDACKKPPETV